jgi:23S rRNA pseudouridine1911/1915/1917 synthase
MTGLAGPWNEPTEAFTFVVDALEAGNRLDVFLHGRLELHSRTYLRDLVRDGQVTVDARKQKPSHRLELGQVVRGTVARHSPQNTLLPQDIPIEILHEDASVLVINKPAGLVVHPGSGRKDQTLANALAFHLKDLSDVGGPLRPGIVHRLDRDTSGVMVIAKSNAAHFALSAQFQERTTEKVYVALVEGEPRLDGDWIKTTLGKAPHDATRVVVDPPSGKPAETRYEVVERFDGFTLVKCYPKTGRTHQIRVHMQHLGHPIVCDQVYGRRKEFRLSDICGHGRSAPDQPLLDRQALHAFRLKFFHPLLGSVQEYEAPVPADLLRSIEALRLNRPYRARKSSYESS